MLEDINAWLRNGLELILPGGYTDVDLKLSLTNCYKALCNNKYDRGILSCPLKLDDVGAVIISYIAFFVMEENKDRKYYYDEYSDRKDPYRHQLLLIITQGSQAYNKAITEEFVNEVLSYLYWSMKRKKCPKIILRPRGEGKFREKNWYIKEPYRSIVLVTDFIYNAMLKVFAVGIKLLDVVLDTINNSIDWSLFLIRNLPYILTGGVVLFAGVQIYGLKKNGRLYGVDILDRRLLQ